MNQHLPDFWWLILPLLWLEQLLRNPWD